MITQPTTIAANVASASLVPTSGAEQRQGDARFNFRPKNLNQQVSNTKTSRLGVELRGVLWRHLEKENETGR